MAPDNFTEPMAPRSYTTLDYIIEAIAGKSYTYYTPLLIVFGILGNVISFYVFVTSKLRMLSTRIYLSVLALSDTIFLLQLLPPWLSAMHIANIFHRPLYCQIVVYLSYVSSCSSAWIVVAFTVERFVAVVYPLQRNSMCTVARAKCTVMVLVLSAMVLNSPLIIFASTSVDDCNIAADYMVHAAWFNVADTIISFTCPLAIIVILNIMITVDVYRGHRERRALQAQGAERVREERACRFHHWGRGFLPPTPPPPRAQLRITRMLLIVSTVFVGLNVPAYTMRILAYAYDMSTAEYSGRWAAMQQITLTLCHTNFGINFILYCLTGQNFRRSLCQAIPCLRNAQEERRINALRLATRNARIGSNATSCGSQDVPDLVAPAVLREAHAARVRRFNSEPAIERWTCEGNHRQCEQHMIEMQDLAAALPEPSSSQRQELTYRSIQFRNRRIAHGLPIAYSLYD